MLRSAFPYILTYLYGYMRFLHQTKIRPELLPTRFYRHRSAPRTRMNLSDDLDLSCRHGNAARHRIRPLRHDPDRLHAEPDSFPDSIIYHVRYQSVYPRGSQSIWRQPRQSYQVLPFLRKFANDFAVEYFVDVFPIPEFLYIVIRLLFQIDRYEELVPSEYGRYPSAHVKYLIHLSCFCEHSIPRFFRRIAFQVQQYRLRFFVSVLERLHRFLYAKLHVQFLAESDDDRFHQVLPAWNQVPF